MKAAYIPVGAGGHILASLPMVSELVKKGVDVSYYAPASFRSHVEKTGAKFVAFPEVTEKYSNPFIGNEDFLAVIPLVFLGQAKEAIQDIMTGLEADRPDLIISDALALAGRLAAWKLNLPLVMVYTTYAPGKSFSIFKTFPEYLCSPARAEAEKMATAFQLEFGGKLLTPQEIFEGTGDYNICTLTKSFQPGGEDFDDRFFFAGAQIASRAGDGQWKAPDNGKPLLYTSLGSLFNNWPAFYQMLFPIVKHMDINVLCSIGKTIKREDLGEIPGNVTVMPFTPQLEVLTHADYFITHAGTGSVMEALYFGVPCVCIPQMDEQVLTANRLKELGCASDVMSKQDVTEERLRAAINELIANPSYRENAQAMSREMRLTGGSERAAQKIIDHVERCRRRDE